MSRTPRTRRGRDVREPCSQCGARAAQDCTRECVARGGGGELPPLDESTGRNASFEGQFRAAPGIAGDAPRERQARNAATAGSWVIDSRSPTNVRSEFGRLIATTAGHVDGRLEDEGHAENLANARLIAAAPELAKLLQTALERGGFTREQHIYARNLLRAIRGQT